MDVKSVNSVDTQNADNDRIVRLLYHLATFNQLNSRILKIVSDVYNIDAEKIAKSEGLTWVVE
jgi:hypothetical protein